MRQMDMSFQQEIYNPRALGRKDTAICRVGLMLHLTQKGLSEGAHERLAKEEGSKIMIFVSYIAHWL